jgi:hypothetical protein
MVPNPKLRAVDIQPVIYEGQQMWLLRDPLALTDFQFILTPALAQMAVFCDGTRDAQQIQKDISSYFETPIEVDVIDQMLQQLDEACFFDNERSQALLEGHLAEFRSLPFRGPALAGVSYPGDSESLSNVLDEFGIDDDPAGWGPWFGRGIISPHIDYHRGGRVYSQVWNRAKRAVKDADLLLIFGTDHNGGPGRINLTRKPYATPWGVIPTDLELVEKLAEAIGPSAFEQELHHRSEHSVELSAVWYHYIYGQDPPPMVPILCGSFHHFVENSLNPAHDPIINAFVETLRSETKGRKVLAVASVDLAHVGPQFGDDFIMDQERRSTLQASDRDLIEIINDGDAERFYFHVAADGDQNRICGFSSIYLMLRYLGPVLGTEIAYEQCQADEKDHSLVSICGLLLK